ncbi:hypothetical protein A4D02_11500 [Niastella koreensis]|uniref:Uncharacterized protein n=2 Tax=Niastella koreensis TaxID=354356 RepID=G8T9J4_NIAKG|nr:hypothetical protein [Niastella koreensis]AEV99184.1 hypothetical protein Niako_2850 [Niastella koreensis GR20-10]OQP44086.1 hypothetical protein A4D02_11500 [Niastella koreensis]
MSGPLQLPYSTQKIAFNQILGTISDFDLPFITNNSEKMQLTTGGYLGLNTTSPAGRLHFVNESLEAGNDYILARQYPAITPARIPMNFTTGRAIIK